MVKKYSHIVAIILFSMTLGITESSFAIESKGDNTLQFSGSFQRSDGSDGGELVGDIGYGYFLSESWEIGIIQSVWYVFLDDKDDIWGASTIPYFNYYMRSLSSSASFQPFIGAFIGASYNEEDSTGTIGPQIGFKSFFNDSTFLVVKYRYEWFFDELTIDEIDDTKSDGNHVISFGFGFVF